MITLDAESPIEVCATKGFKESNTVEGFYLLPLNSCFSFWIEHFYNKLWLWACPQSLY